MIIDNSNNNNPGYPYSSVFKGKPQSLLWRKQALTRGPLRLNAATCPNSLGGGGRSFLGLGVGEGKVGLRVGGVVDEQVSPESANYAGKAFNSTQ